MVIKNTDILVRRAKEHKRLDHISQKTYGQIGFLQNGETETIKWRGCAISCLATETSIQGLMEQEDLDISKVFVKEWEDGRSEFEVRIQPESLRSMLNKKFGMSNLLIHMAECIFEGSSDEYCVDWPLRFSEALYDGLEITNQDVQNFWSEVVVPYWEGEYEYFPVVFDPDNYEDEEYGIWEIDEYFDFCHDYIGDRFLDFLSEIADRQKQKELVAA